MSDCSFLIYQGREESPNTLSPERADKIIAANSRPPQGARCEQKRRARKSEAPCRMTGRVQLKDWNETAKSLLSARTKP